MAEMTNRYLALELAVRMRDEVGDGTGAVNAAQRFYDFLEGGASAAGEAQPARKPRAKAAAPASSGASTESSAKTAAEEDLFGSSAESAEVPKAATKTAAPTAATASSGDDDLFGETAPAKEEAKPKATIEQLRKALTEVQSKHGHKDHALGILKKHTRDGNPTISTLDEAKYQDVIDACAKYVPAK
jgi:predicted lipid-binding transport protein (Tim44 family)